MLRYVLSAMMLKAFSCTHHTRHAYRALGNIVGGRKRTTGQMPTYYFGRVQRMLRIAGVYEIPKAGDNVLELGTGWLHWEAITTRLFFDVRGVLFDVWDNRQLAGLKNYLGQLDKMLDKLDVGDAKRTAAHEFIAKINGARSFQELYDILGFQYVVNESGSLGGLKKESFDLIVSAGVLEHISAKDAPEFINGIAALLKPGGYSVHSINIMDHLFQYDSTVSKKQYLRYPDWVWRLCFENDVQYINRIQRQEWLEHFRRAGLVQIEEELDVVELASLQMSQKYGNYSETDLQCIGLKVVHRKPLGDLSKLGGETTRLIR